MYVLGRIKMLMEIRGWSKYRLAKEAGLSNSTINHMFRNSNSPALPTLEAICKAFQMDLGQFFSKEEEPALLTLEEKRILALSRQLSKGQMRTLGKLIETFVES